MKIETTTIETVSTDARNFTEVADGVYYGDEGQVLVFDTDGKSAVLITRKPCVEGDDFPSDFAVEQGMKIFMGE